MKLCLLAVTLLLLLNFSRSDIDLLSEQSSLEDISVNSDAVEEDWGDGLKVLSIYKPKSCDHLAERDDVIHYHYVGRLASDGSVFGKSFDYNSPYIVALGQGRIIPGMDRGLIGICLWERRRISFPPHLGYGDRGVGDTIPPNASLVFYVRLIKLIRNGRVLGEDANISDIWHSGLVSYSTQKWQQAVDMMNEAQRLFDQYDNQTLMCIKRCESEDTYLSNKTKTFLKEYYKDNPFVEQLAQYAVNGKCLKICKIENLPPKLRNPDPVLIASFRSREPYSYLHYSYYQIQNYDEAARCCFTFLHYNPTDELALSSISYYRDLLNMTENDFIYKESDLDLYQTSYIKGVSEYEQENWLEAVDNFENSVRLFENAHSECCLLCKDMTNINLTETDMSDGKKELLEEYDFFPDSMEYNEVLVMAIKEILKCRVSCFDRASVNRGYVGENYFRIHFDYLQYGYFMVGNFLKAVESAATYLAIDPSSETMANNLHYYMTTFKLESKEVIPREAIVQLHQKHEMNKRLLYFTENSELQKKMGVKGDSGEQVSHKEL